MNFTTTTKLAREGSKAFEKSDYSIVLNNNKDIGLIIGGELAKAVLDSGVLQQIREELWELNDETTVRLVEGSRAGNYEDSISLEDYRKKYGI